MKKILFLILTLCSSVGLVYSDITWSAPSTISTPLVNASNPDVVIDSNNNITSIWIEAGQLLASSLPSGGSWSVPVVISDVLNTASSPKLAVDASGNVTALWIENTLVKSRILPFSGVWGTTATVSSSGAASPSIAMDSSGNVVAVWTRSGFVESSTRKLGTWSLVSVISVTNSDNPHVAISSFGTAIAIWHSTISGSDMITSNILTISSNTWGTSKNLFLASASFKHNYPKIALDSIGNAVACWFRYNVVNSNGYQNSQVVTSTLAVGAANWAVLAALSNQGLRNPADLTIKVRFDTNGDALVVWTNSYDGETFVVESARRLFGATVWPNFASPQNPTLYSFGIDVAIVSGSALLTNMAWDEISAIQIQSQQTDTNDPILQAWTIINPLSTGNSNAYPKCALSITGSTLNAVVVWLHFDGVNNVINVATGSDSVIDPPTGISASQSVTDFGVYQDYYNTITWSASSDPDLIQYNIYRNGIFFAATDPGVLEFIDNNTIQNGTVTYGVAALTSSFRQSNLITFTLFP